MAGRTGAAFAAQIGTMQVNEEVDALITMGVSAHGVLGFAAHACSHSDDVASLPLRQLGGHTGRVCCCTGMFDISFTQYMEQTRLALNLTHFGLGILRARSLAFSLP